MVFLVFEGVVPQEQWATFEAAFHQYKVQRPPQVRQVFLMQSDADPTVWRIIGLWESREALDAMLSSGHTLPAYHMFQAVGVVPTRTSYAIKAHVVA